MPPTLATPATAQAMLDAGQRNVTLSPGEYDALYVRADTATMLSLNGSGMGATVTNGVHIIGRALDVTVSHMTVRGHGVQSVDGVDHLSLSGVAVEDVTGPVGINVTGHDDRPVLNLTISGCRVRRCEIGLMIGQVIRWALYDFWAHACELATNPGDPSRHGVYLNDAVAVAGDVHGALITNCGGTSFRGTGSRAYDCIAWNCGGSMAGSRNCEMMSRFTSLDAGPIEVGAQGPCVVEDPYGSVYIKGTCRSPWLQIPRPRFAPGQVIDGADRYPLPDQDVPGRFGTLTITDPQTIQALDRNPATFCRDVLGGTADLDSLWGKSFSVAAMNKYIRGIA